MSLNLERLTNQPRDENEKVIEAEVGAPFRPFAGVTRLNGSVKRQIRIPGLGSIVLNLSRISVQGLESLPQGETVTLLGYRLDIPLTAPVALVITTPQNGPYLPRATLEITDGDSMTSGDEDIPVKLRLTPPKGSGVYTIKTAGVEAPVVIPGIPSRLQRLSMTITGILTDAQS